ncbi:hypothetical protein [Arthrobacter burdickii]|uniref:Uncharacterized protein n=1 Tax=Arthrobacter burdickii TaxID=3035920 RepID=A0ABT8K154_9MICC|nr:hypothetical protein [Arthrobacter burdickii]MDN4611160.1 hypothetical protein [Arthrobacter burdickii]
MRSRRYATTLATVGLLIGGAVGPLAPAAYADHTRAHTCLEAGGVYTEAATQGGDRCVVTTRTAGPIVVGAPETTYSDAVPSGSPTVVESDAAPSGEATAETETRDVGSPVVVESKRFGELEITSADSDAGEPAVESAVVPGAPTTTTRTERGTPISTDAPGTRNCRRLNDDKAAKPVERCERTVVTTTTTPTTVITTVTTPQERVTTTTQPRETVTTTTTPVTEVFTSTQQQESCATTTQPTSFTRTTTQATTRTQTVSIPRTRTVTTTVTTYRYTLNTTAPLVPVVFTGPNAAANPRIAVNETALAPLVTTLEQPGPLQVTVETLAGPDLVNTICASTAPEVIVTDGATTDDVQRVTAPADSEVTVTRENIDPLVTGTSAPGQPIVTTSTRGTGATCYNNPATAEQRASRC